MNGKRNTAFDKLMEQHDELPGAKAEDNDADSWEEQSADGPTCGHQVFGLQLIDAQKKMAFIPYGSIAWGEGFFNGRSFKFEFARGEELWEAVIEGDLELQQIVDKITAGKRESVQVNSESVTTIAWENRSSQQQ